MAQTLDIFLPLIEAAKSRGAVIVLKWDGERSQQSYTVVITRRGTDYLWRTDTDDICGALAEGLADYAEHHP